MLLIEFGSWVAEIGMSVGSSLRSFGMVPECVAGTRSGRLPGFGDYRIFGIGMRRSFLAEWQSSRLSKRIAWLFKSHWQASGNKKRAAMLEVA